MELDYDTLKARQRELRDDFPTALGLRTHRALSWLRRAEGEKEDADARFLFLWIAFNAAYANDLPDRSRFADIRLISEFLQRLVRLDRDELLYGVLWKRYPGPVRLLIDNRYVFQPFWDFHNGKIEKAHMEEKFARSQSAAKRALARGKTHRLLGEVLNRLYTLRNQLVHGGATWQGSVNRQQVVDGAEIMGFLVPIVIHLMMENHQLLWGDPCYPVVD